MTHRLSEFRGVLKDWKLVYDQPFLRHVEGKIYGHAVHKDGTQTYTKSILAMTRDGSRIFTLTSEFELDPPYEYKKPPSSTSNASTVP